MSQYICHCDNPHWVVSLRINDELVESVTVDATDPNADAMAAQLGRHQYMLVSAPGVTSWGVTMECPGCHGAMLIDPGDDA